MLFVYGFVGFFMCGNFGFADERFGRFLEGRKHRDHPVIILRRQRIVFVIVTPRTTHRYAHKHGRSSRHHVVHNVAQFIRPIFFGHRIVLCRAVETKHRRDKSFGITRLELVVGQLRQNKL